VKDSAVAMYFKRQVELSTMYRTMEGHNYATPEDAILAVKNGSVFLFFYGHNFVIRTFHEISKTCTQYMQTCAARPSY